MIYIGQQIMINFKGHDSLMEVKGFDDSVVVLFSVDNGEGIVVERKSLEEDLGRLRVN